MALLAGIVSRVFLEGAGIGGLTTWLVLLVCAVFLRAGLVWAREVVAERGAVRVKAEIRERLFSHILRLGPAYAAGERAGELTTTATEGVERLEPYFARYLPQALLSVLVPVMVAAYVATQDLTSAVLLLATAPVIPVMMVLVGSYAEEHTRRQWTALSRLGAHFLDALQGLPTLKAFGRARNEAQRLAETGEEFRGRTMKVLGFAFLSGLVLEFMTSAAIALLAVMLGVRLIGGAVAFEQAFLVLLLAPEFYRPLRELGVHRHAGMEGKAAAERIRGILQTPAGADIVPRDIRPFRAVEVEISEVGFSHPEGSRHVLDGVSMTLPVGSITALVGRSGAGKSTLVNLLLRFLEPGSGTITANGLPIAGLPVDAWRENVALVPQRPHLFHGSVLENILVARPDASREEVERAAELAGAAAFVRELPQGYETGIGERGARLSGGEAQRIAIARAFLKDAPLLIMDEATSGLDPESEQSIRRAMERLVRGRTTLVVAHRLNTVRNADCIHVLDGGRVVESGTHAALLANGGVYARLVGAGEGVPA
jgi:ATP-binding cassette subfamily C protein CydD